MMDQEMAVIAQPGQVTCFIVLPVLVYVVYGKDSVIVSLT